MQLEEAARIVREAVRDKSYQLTPLGDEAAGYLRSKRKRLTDASFRDYESILDKLCRHFADKQLGDFGPPVGTELLEEFLDHQWGAGAPRTYNKALSILRDFFRFQVLREKLHGDPTLAIERARSRQVYRTTFTEDQRRAIMVSQGSRRDRLALRLLLDYGLRKGSLREIQLQHFDHQRKRLVLTKMKGGKVREVPIPDPNFWVDLERHVLDSGAEGHWYLLCARSHAERRYGACERPSEPMSTTSLHRWWYKCLENAGIVASGTTSGERMHKARHTAGQRILDRTGDLKLTQKLLGHSSIQTTGDIYVDYDVEQLADKLARVLADKSFQP